ncbi:ATP-binding cassette domain-containing protein [Aeromicrobium sp.]|uniref:ATP-binding cassette domain-containing protein n=1 Tax=Aeromicrobium sp. TaxID=1871063 RepID=UPI004033D46D
MAASLSFHHVTHTWPDGAPALSDVDLVLGPGLHGLVGSNGSGKSTLLRLAHGDLVPTGGSVLTTGSLELLPQDPVRTVEGLTVADVLDVADTLVALRAIEAGSTDQADFDRVGDDWDVEERAAAWLARLGLGSLGLDRAASSLSDGELVLLALAGRLLRRPDVVLLDEPTNNLDRRARAHLTSALGAFGGVALVASHDRELLEGMDTIVEVHAGRVRTVTGGFSVYEEVVAAEQEAAVRAVRDAKADVRRQERELVEARAKLAQRKRTAHKAEAEKRVPKIVAHGRRMAAEVSAGKLRGAHEEHVARARADLDAAEERVRDDREIRLELPDTAVPRTRDVLVTEGLVLPHVGTEVALHLRGPERVALTGPNGSGKTTFLQVALGRLAPAAGSATVSVPVGRLAQRPTLPDEDASVLENVRRVAPEADPQHVRAQLARLLFRGRAAERIVSTLSGGERLRAALACVLLADPAPQLLLLDEPTNDLDLVSVGHLVEALRGYRGALLVVSHDERFLDELELDHRVALPSPSGPVRPARD